MEYTGIYSYLRDKSELLDPVNKTISKYHTRVLFIKDKIIPAAFSVKEAFLPDIEKVLRNLNTKEASTFRNITPTTLRKNKQSCSEILTELFNNILLTFSFPTDRKVVDVRPIFKKNDPLKQKAKELSVYYPVVSKIFERLLHKQMSLHVDRFPPP